MLIRPLKPADLDDVVEIDATIESEHYLHLTRQQADEDDPFTLSWSLEPRELRRPLAESNLPDDSLRLRYRQVAEGVVDGLALCVEVGNEPVSSLLAETDHDTNALRLIDLRTDSDHRREGFASALLYQAITHARDAEHRALLTSTRANQHPAAVLLAKTGFALTGLDETATSNHDVVAERATVMWTMPLT